jgi:hypothetical protein
MKVRRLGLRLRMWLIAIHALWILFLHGTNSRRCRRDILPSCCSRVLMATTAMAPWSDMAAAEKLPITF